MTLEELQDKIRPYPQFPEVVLIDLMTPLYEQEIEIYIEFSDWKSEEQFIFSHDAVKILNNIPTSHKTTIEQARDLCIQRGKTQHETGQFIQAIYPDLSQVENIFEFGISSNEYPFTQEMIQQINDLANLNEKELDYLKELMFWNFNICCETIFYDDFDINLKEGETEVQANKRYFQVDNKEDAYRKTTLLEVEMTDSSPLTFHFESEWCFNLSISIEEIKQMKPLQN